MLRFLNSVGNLLILVIILAQLLLCFVSIALQFPSVQTLLVKKASEYVSGIMGYPVEIGKVNIKWFDVVSLEQVSVKDSRKQDMIDVARLDVNIDMLGLVKGKYWGTRLEEVSLFRPDVNLQKNPKTGELNMDEFIARIEELTSSGDTTGRDQNKPFVIGKATIYDGIFRFGDQRHPPVKEKTVFDYRNFTLTGVSARLKDFTVLGDTITFDAHGLRAKDRHTGLELHRLDTRFLHCRKKIELDELTASIGNSTIRNYISFNFEKPADLGDFNNKVELKAHFQDSRILSADLGLFAEYLLTLKEEWRITGDFQGTVKDFKLTGTRLAFGEKSLLQGEFSFKGLPDFEKTGMFFKLQESEILASDLVQYYPRARFHEVLGKFGAIRTSAIYAGSIEDFTLKGEFETAIGALDTDLVFHVRDNPTTTYKGYLKTTGLELGVLLDDTETFDKLDFAGNIDGVGLNLHTASTHVSARVARIGVRGYDYQNVSFEGNLQKSYFNGRVSSRDTNLIFQLDGEIDFTQPQNYFDLQGIVEQANLGSLGFTKDPLRLHTRVNLQLKGNTADELTGQARLSDIYLLKPRHDRNLVLDSLILKSEGEDGFHRFSLNSAFLNASLEGTFTPSAAINDLKGLLKEYELYFLGNETERSNYYTLKKKAAIRERYKIDYEVKTGDTRKLLDFLVPELYLSPGMSLSGEIQWDNTAFVSLSGKVDTLRWAGTTVTNSEIDVNTSKFINSADVLASAFITSEKQDVRGFTNTERLFVDAAWDKDHIHFKGGVRQVESTNRAVLNGDLRFIPSGMELVLHEGSQFLLLSEVWKVNPKNQLLVEGPRISFRNVAIGNGRQLVSLNGETGDRQDLKVEVRNFRLSSVNTLFKTELEGIMDGDLTLRDQDLGREMDVYFNVEGLRYAAFELGNFTARGDWDRISKRLELQAGLEKNMKKTLAISGFYSPEEEENALDIRGVFNGAELKVIEPFAHGIVSNISGVASGTVMARGKLTRPVLSGELTVEKGRATFDYLQAVFTFNDKIRFGESEIIVKNMQLTDPDGNKATLTGGVYHDGFRYFTLGFDADFRGFKILNTTANDNDLFYGVANVTGQASVYGPIDNLTINATVTSNKGTRIYIPFDGAKEVATQEYVVFLSQLIKDRDSTGVAIRRRRSEASGIKMNFNFNITPDAYCEIQLDRQTGDILKAYGTGLLNLKIDTKGDFAMTGSYAIDRGEYTFTLQNAINKRFEIKPGSRISWTGDPYEAQANVKASYTQLTSLADVLLTNSGGTLADPALQTAATKRYPVELIISLTERLMSPKVSYNLQFKEYPNTQVFRNNIAAFENRLQNDEQELSKQVSSLLLFNTLLSPNNPLFGGQSGFGLGSSVSELISNQISKWASALDQNLEVGLMGLTLNENMMDNLQLRFSYRFLNDRFRITRDGRFKNVENNYDAASLLGEWTLEYWFTPDGSIRGKAYNRNIQNPLQWTNMQTTAGFSLQFTHSFNRFLLPAPLRQDSVRTDSSAIDSTTRKSLLPKLKWVPLSSLGK